MRRLLITIIALSIFYQVFGYLIVFNANVFISKKEMKAVIKAGLQDSDKQFFSFSRKEYEQLDWVDEKEFKLNNVMYDIIKRTILDDGRIMLECINDVKETELFANLSEQIDDNSDLNNTGKPISKVLLKLLKVNCLLDLNEDKVIFAAIEFPYLNYTPQVLTISTGINTPPPKF